LGTDFIVKFTMFFPISGRVVGKLMMVGPGYTIYGQKKGMHIGRSVVSLARVLLKAWDMQRLSPW
jgi:hypothetical protein